MNFELSLSSMLAHSAVFFSRQEWLPVADARADGKNTAQTDQEEFNEQLALDASGNSGIVTGVGAGAGAGAGSTGSVAVGAYGDLSHVAGSGNVSTVNVTTDDPQVVDTAVASNTVVANTALDDLESGTTADVTAISNVANSSIAAGVAYTNLNDAFGEDALSAAANAEANSTTALEAMGTESETTANNALAAAQNETLAGVTPAQEFQAVEPNVPGSPAKLSTLATWVAVISGGLAIYFYVFRKKA